MPAELVNLRTLRRQREREAARRRGDAAAAKTGPAAAEAGRARAEAEREARRLDAHRRDAPER